MHGVMSENEPTYLKLDGLTLKTIYFDSEKSLHGLEFQDSRGAKVMLDPSGGGRRLAESGATSANSVELQSFEFPTGPSK